MSSIGGNQSKNGKDILIIGGILILLFGGSIKSFLGCNKPSESGCQSIVSSARDLEAERIQIGRTNGWQSQEMSAHIEKINQNYHEFGEKGCSAYGLTYPSP